MTESPPERPSAANDPTPAPDWYGHGRPRRCRREADDLRTVAAVAARAGPGAGVWLDRHGAEVLRWADPAPLARLWWSWSDEFLAVRGWSLLGTPDLHSPGRLAALLRALFPGQEEKSLPALVTAELWSAARKAGAPGPARPPDFPLALEVVGRAFRRGMDCDSYFCVPLSVEADGATGGLYVVAQPGEVERALSQAVDGAARALAGLLPGGLPVLRGRSVRE